MKYFWDEFGGFVILVLIVLAAPAAIAVVALVVWLSGGFQAAPPFNPAAHPPEVIVVTDGVKVYRKVEPSERGGTRYVYWTVPATGDVKVKE